MAVQFPLTLISIGAGVLFIMRRLPTEYNTENNGRDKGTWSDLLREVLPNRPDRAGRSGGQHRPGRLRLALPPMTAVYAPGWPSAWSRWSIQNRTPTRMVVKAVVNRSVPPMNLIIFGIMSFKGVLLDSQAVAGIQAEMNPLRHSAPADRGHQALPDRLHHRHRHRLRGQFLSPGGAAAGRPGRAELQWPNASLAYAFGYMGMMLSPVHLCFLVTKDYYASSLLGSYRLIMAPVLVVMAAVLIFFRPDGMADLKARCL
jgi:hypothetical protein